MDDLCSVAERCVFLPAPTSVMFPPSSAPVLLPQTEEMVVPLHTSFTLTCRGEAKLAWETPLDVPEKTQEDNSGLFVTTITVDKATAMHTGYYKCSYSRNTTEDTDNSHIYVYVPGMGYTAYLSCVFSLFDFIIGSEKLILLQIRSRCPLCAIAGAFWQPRPVRPQGDGDPVSSV